MPDLRKRNVSDAWTACHPGRHAVPWPTRIQIGTRVPASHHRHIRVPSRKEPPRAVVTAPATPRTEDTFPTLESSSACVLHAAGANDKSVMCKNTYRHLILEVAG